MNDRAAQRCTEIVPHQMIRRTHFIERSRIERIVAQKLVNGPVQLVRPAACDDVDLPTKDKLPNKKGAGGIGSPSWRDY